MQYKVTHNFTASFKESFRLEMKYKFTYTSNSRRSQITLLMVHLLFVFRLQGQKESNNLMKYQVKSILKLNLFLLQNPQIKSYQKTCTKTCRQACRNLDETYRTKRDKRRQLMKKFYVFVNCYFILIFLYFILLFL